MSRVPVDGMQDSAVYKPGSMDMDRADVHLRKPFEVHATINKVSQELVVNADIRCPAHFVCARCLEEFTSTMAIGTIFSYQVKPTDIIDITDDVRQEIILAYPIIPLCRPGCKGLCKNCGKNLNLESCQCKQSTQGGTQSVLPKDYA